MTWKVESESTALLPKSPEPLVKRSLLVSVPYPGSSAFLIPESRIRDRKKFGSGIQNDPPGLYFLELCNNFLGYKYLNFLLRIQIRDPGSGMEQFGFGIRDISCLQQCWGSVTFRCGPGSVPLTNGSQLQLQLWIRLSSLNISMQKNLVFTFFLITCPQAHHIIFSLKSLVFC